MKYIMAFDQGTTSSRTLLIDENGVCAASAQYEYTQYFPTPGWVEHDPEEIWQTQYRSARDAMAKLGIGAKDIAAIGITNQRETTVLWNRRTGKPAGRAIVWQCRRTADYCRELEPYRDMLHAKTGLVIDPYFSGTKIHWMLENIPGVRDAAERGELAFGTVDSWLIWKLTGGSVHATDFTNASRTMLFNIHDLQWDGDILKLMNIPASLMPEVRMSSGSFGVTDSALFGGEIPILGAAGDQHAALFGQHCVDPGDVKNTYGTGCFMLMNTGDKPVDSKNGLLTTIAWGIDGKINYALEGSVFVAGAAVQWLRDEMHFVTSAGDTEARAASVSDTCGVYFVPAFTGLGAPYWNADARGAIVGLTRGTGTDHIIRAALESIAYQTDDVLSAMIADAGKTPDAIRVDGGACANNFLMQFQSDISRIKVERPKNIESTAYGAALLAGHACGFFENDGFVCERSFVPDMAEEKRLALLDGWHRAVNRIM